MLYNVTRCAIRPCRRLAQVAGHVCAATGRRWPGLSAAAVAGEADEVRVPVRSSPPPAKSAPWAMKAAKSNNIQRYKQKQQIAPLGDEADDVEDEAIVEENDEEEA